MNSHVAVLGANGFIGSRLVELWHPDSRIVVRPIVRDPSAMARTARFRLAHAFADALNVTELKQAFQGCDCVVHTVSGGERAIVQSIEPVYRAAEASHVRRLVYLSTASVHGQAPSPGVDERTPLRTDHPIAYNNAKVLAEQQLLELRDGGSVEVVILRPGIVYGPRSSWIGGFADELLSGEAYVVNGGTGICNSIYVDNLAHAIYSAIAAQAVDRERFLIGDAEQVTWQEFYRPLAEAFGMRLEEVRSVTWDGRIGRESSRLAGIRESHYVQWLRPFIPGRVRRTVSRALAGWTEYGGTESPWNLQTEGPPITPSLERALLHSCTYKLPMSKAARVLGYEPPVPFVEGIARSISWLAFAGYPVRTSLLVR